MVVVGAAVEWVMVKVKFAVVVAGGAEPGTESSCYLRAMLAAKEDTCSRDSLDPPR